MEILIFILIKDTNFYLYSFKDYYKFNKKKFIV